MLECRTLKPLKRDRDPSRLQVNISITGPSVTPPLRRHNPISDQVISNLRHGATAQPSAPRIILMAWLQLCLNTSGGRAWRWSDL